MKKLLLIMTGLTMTLALAACEDKDFDAYDTLRQDILQEVGTWDTKSVYNEVTLTDGTGQMPEHYMLELHENQTPEQRYMVIRDLSDGGSVTVHFTYVEGDTAYVYENYENTDPEDFDDPDDYIQENYEIVNYEDISEWFPQINTLILDGLSEVPGEEYVEEPTMDFNEHSVEYDPEEGSFDVAVEINYQDEHNGTPIDEDMLWQVEGSFNEFTITSPNPEAGELRVVKQDYLSDFELDKEPFEALE